MEEAEAQLNSPSWRESSTPGERVAVVEERKGKDVCSPFFAACVVVVACFSDKGTPPPKSFFLHNKHQDPKEQSIAFVRGGLPFGTAIILFFFEAKIICGWKRLRTFSRSLFWLGKRCLGNVATYRLLLAGQILLKVWFNNC
ncbi:hypothetical protein BSKO_10347 [Bryopsis sp. KO-2023]|nr:hypothetical protein BSKO_10347 [Bryopsis sp. KO-2023]